MSEMKFEVRTTEEKVKHKAISKNFYIIQLNSLILYMYNKQGRGLFATCFLKEGDVIFEEIPIVSCQFAWNEDYGYQACELCLR